MAHWTTIRGDDSVTIKTIVVDGRVAGHLLRFDEAGRPEVSYWLGKDYWGQGIATGALAAFLSQVRERPCTRARPKTIAPRCGSCKSADSRSAGRTKDSPTRAAPKSRNTS